jgi:hypothetical protein
MLIVNLAGGLGNQMFQFAMGYSLSARTGIPVVYSSTFSEYPYRPKTIDQIFNVDLDWCDSDVLTKCMGIVPSSPFSRRALGKIATILHRQISSNLVFDLLLGYQSLNIIDPERDYYIHGYWQSERYFQDYVHLIREKFAFRQVRDLIELSPGIQSYDVKVGVHLRRGDYITNPKAALKMGLPTPEYYIDGLHRFRHKFCNSKIFVFSDDIEWARNFLSPYFNDIWFSDLSDGNASSDMQMLSQCDHFLLSNSTFGWWSAYLSTNDNKIVITPNKWFADGTNDSDIVPRQWSKSRSRLNYTYDVT